MSSQVPFAVNVVPPSPEAAALAKYADVPVDPYRRHIFIAQAPDASSVIGEWRVPASRIMVIDFDTTFYFHREGAGMLFGMGDPDETPTFDTTVQWDFLPHDGGTEVAFFVDFEFRSRILQAAIGVVFNEAVRRMVNAFRKRARDVYGPPVVS